MPEYFLLYAPATSTTGQELTRKLQEAGLDIGCGREVTQRYQGVVRWGATGRMRFRPGKIINQGTAIQVATNKLDFMETMRGAGIRVPVTWGAASNNIRFPCLGRKREHTGGTDIVLCLQKSDVQKAVTRYGCEFFSEYIPTSRELRVHVFEERVIKSSQKVETPDENGNFEPWIPWIRNLESGYTFRVPEERVPATTKYLAVQAVELAGLNFGAVDIIISDEGYPYVLEVNTAPGLHTDSGFEAYVSSITEAFRAQ